VTDENVRRTTAGNGDAKSRRAEARIRARNRAKILKAAVELFARKGFDGVRITEIARLSGLPKANIYYYFPSKSDIYQTLIDDVLSEWDAALAHIRAVADPREALTAYITAKLAYSRTHAAQSRLFAGEMLRGGSFLSRAQKQHMREVTQDHAAVLETWIADGRMTAVHPRHFLIMLWASTQYYADFEAVVGSVLETRRLKRTDYETAAATIVTTVLDGCGTGAG